MRRCTTSVFVLIHGAWHGAWCWESVAGRLHRRGHTVAAPDLPGHGEDRTPAGRVTMQTCTDYVTSLLDRLPEPAVLVGHSFGGAVVSQVAELRPDAVASTIYLCAFLLRDGQSVWRHGLPSPRSPGAGPLVLRPENLVVDRAEGTVDLDRSVVAGGFYAGCRPADRERALARWRPEPLAPLQTPLVLSENFARVPRGYICTLDDRVVPPAAQRRMCRATPCRRVVELDSGHSPFLSAPAEVAGHLLRLSEELATPRAGGGNP